MDPIDERMVSLLRANARASYVELGRELGLTEGAVRHRMRKLTSSGIIKRFTIVTGSSVISSVVFVRSSLSKETADTGVSIKGIEGVVRVAEISGDWDLMVDVSCRTTVELNDAINEIRRLDGVQATSSLTVLNEL